jgi:hypothetical protein
MRHLSFLKERAGVKVGVSCGYPVGLAGLGQP